MRDSMVIYTSYLDKFGSLNDAQFGQLMRALLQYQATGEVPSVEDSMVGLCFGIAKYDIDENNRKYAEKCEKQRQNIEKRWAKKADTMEYHGIPTNTNEYQRIPNDTDYTYKEKDKEKEKEKEQEQEKDIGEGEGEGRETFEVPSENAHKRAEDVRRIVNAWNTLPNVPPIKSVDHKSTRYKMLCSRIEENGVEAVLDAIENVRRSSFLQGTNNRGWTVDFSWFVRPNNFPKVYEGNYNDKQKVTGNTSRAFSAIDDMEWGD